MSQRKAKTEHENRLIILPFAAVYPHMLGVKLIHVMQSSVFSELICFAKPKNAGKVGVIWTALSCFRCFRRELWAMATECFCWNR